MNDSTNEVSEDNFNGRNENDDLPDPLLTLPFNTLQVGEHFLLHFSDGRQVFGQCLTKVKGMTPTVKINKRSYPTYNLIGLPYGTVLEVERNFLLPLPADEDLIPSHPLAATKVDEEISNESDTGTAAARERDNRHIVDTNTSQALDQKELVELRNSCTEGAKIVEKIIENSSTFAQKTDYSRAKYVVRKQQKYQPRCRLVRCTGPTICEAMFLKDAKRIMNLRDDTLGQILSYGNVSAGCQVLIWETCYGIITGTLAQRMGGYGQILSVYTGQQHSFNEILSKFNLSFPESSSISWVHSGDIYSNTGENDDEDEVDVEKKEREVIQWPCPLQNHTRKYIETFPSRAKQEHFLMKRAARFARKLTRRTPLEARNLVLSRKSDCVVVAVRYDATETLLALLPHLAPSCPFVVYCEFIEPLTLCFLELQRNNLAVNLRLSDTWAREYQILPGRTHPNMTMRQSGGFLLTGIKLDPVFGINELDEDLLKEIRQQMGGRRGKRPRTPNEDESNKKMKSLA
ncbi:tRNA (adenine-N(1)-)-methyltransferase non-catalytic subunit [Fistulifera solaris]|uniref:tRNA (adenine(58)-N(1))-methyltransferase non-catalytic subunit TRM6 n=1 Tax=Fistulifera solaris TaxID=1519565 RepID=A0A1Z5KDU3_FISSO|nr:tRNA (adenine-N(1)-)-methyltransferase non-catalytic subunit [Fistulifera solaris]|eukprot:GAX24305.1 tRNA (adenine-N(1)-)-methyltransferase non-catalytic subunit [Fistulifera solaris]